MRIMFGTVAVAAALAACAPAAPPAPKEPAADTAAADTAAIEEAAHRAHQVYVDAINSNDVERILAVMTEDVVYQAPHEPAVVGKAAVKAWLEGYLAAYKTHWEKTSSEFVVSDEWAFELYSYKSTDTPKAGGPVVEDVGKGINIYHFDVDTAWRIARDSWNTDKPLPATPASKPN